MKVRDMLSGSRVYGLWDEVKELTRKTWGEVEHYRDDPWWHNAYKFRVNKAYPETSYDFSCSRTMKFTEDCSVRLRVWQKNGDVAWTSPVFVKVKK